MYLYAADCAHKNRYRVVPALHAIFVDLSFLFGKDTAACCACHVEAASLHRVALLCKLQRHDWHYPVCKPVTPHQTVVLVQECSTALG